MGQKEKDLLVSHNEEKKSEEEALERRREVMTKQLEAFVVHFTRMKMSK